MATVRARGIQAGLKPDEIAQRIDAAYPFGERAHYPYKAWLSARKEFFARYGLPMKTSKKKQPDLLT